MPKVQSKTKGHFEKVDGGEKKVQCKLCSAVLSTGGGTSNMLSHLKRKHSDIINNSEADTSVNQNVNVSTAQDNPSVPDLKKADQELTLMMATDFQPFSLVDDKGFRKFVQSINPNYKIPDKRVIRYELLPKMFNEAKTKLKRILSEIENLSMTTDTWTSNSMQSYITITIHFFHENSLKSCVLTTVPLKQSHTADNMKEIVHEILTKWQIRDKIVCITTDNGQNVCKMVRLLGIRHMPCFAHTLNLVIDDSLCDDIPELKDLIEKCKKIVKFFKQSNVATLSLQQEQRERNPNVEPLQLIQEVSTRWNSLYYMMKRILKLIDSLTIVQRKLPQAPEIITPDEEKTLRDIVLLLDVFEQATKMISGEQYPTSSLIIPIIYGLYDNVRILGSRIATTVGEKFLQNLKRFMNERLLTYESRTVCRISTILHPAFRNSFRMMENKLAAKEAVKAEINNIVRVRQVRQISESTEESLARASTSDNDRPSLLGFLKYINTNTDTSSATAINLLRMYTETNFSDINNNWDKIVAFWNFNKHLKPLDEIAFKYFTVPATSVRSERVFSTTGYILNDRRNMLRNDAVEMLCFLHENYRLLK